MNPKCEDGDVLHDNQLRIVCEFHLLLFWIVTPSARMLMEDAEVWTPIAQGAGAQVARAAWRRRGSRRAA